MPRSRLVLGTVQLGVKYGVNNTEGIPTKEEAFAILDAALAGGINTFDTAAAYGAAEEVLGEWIKARDLADTVFIVSKMKANAPDVRREVEASLSRLGLQRLDGYLLHAPQDLYVESVMSGLRAVKDAGLVGRIGVSVYEESDARRAALLGVDYIQVPYNVLDRRLDAADFFTLAKKSGVTVFARSPFLQGLLLMKPDELPPHLLAARPHLERFIKIAEKYELSQLEASLLFVYNRAPDHIVFGANNTAQLKQILAAAQKTPQKDWTQEMEEAFHNVEIEVMDPRLWKK